MATAEQRNLKVHAPEHGKQDRNVKNWRKWWGQLGARHTRILTLMAQHPEGLTATEVGEVGKIKRSYTGSLCRELVLIGLFEAAGVRQRKAGPHEKTIFAHVYKLTPKGQETVKWLQSNPNAQKPEAGAGE